MARRVKEIKEEAKRNHVDDKCAWYAPKLTRQYNINPDTTSRVSQDCKTCGGSIAVGDRINNFDSKGAARLICDSMNIPKEVAEVISALTEKVHTTCHADCAGINKTITSSGRVSRPPVRLSDEKFISGSGFVGCDTYDRNFNYSDLSAQAYHVVDKSGPNLASFVVDDNDEDLGQDSDISEDEGEWNFDDEEDEEDEEYAESWDDHYFRGSLCKSGCACDSDI